MNAASDHTHLSLASGERMELDSFLSLSVAARVIGRLNHLATASTSWLPQGCHGEPSVAQQSSLATFVSAL